MTATVERVTAQGAGAAGRRLGRYHLAEPLGAGPTGEVFRARSTAWRGSSGSLPSSDFIPSWSPIRIAPDFWPRPRASTARSSTRASRGSTSSVLPAARLSPPPSWCAASTLAAARRDLGAGGALPPGASALADRGGGARARLRARARAGPPRRVPAQRALHRRGGREGDRLRLTCRCGCRRGRRRTRAFSRGCRTWRPSSCAASRALRPPMCSSSGWSRASCSPARRRWAAPAPREVQRRALGGEPHVASICRGRWRRSSAARWRARPIERFSDATALADALDAAARASPLAGDRRDVAAMVRTAVDQRAEMHESQMSGALRLPVPAPPRPTAQMAAVAPPTARGGSQACRSARWPRPLPTAPAATRPPTASPRTTPPPVAARRTPTPCR